MGGVDLADFRRLHCNSTIMGQNRLWLKLFFYLLDVGTSNALVLYRETLPEDMKKNINLVEFKQRLVMSFIGPKLGEVEVGIPVPQHKLVRTEARHQCGYERRKANPI